MDEGSEPQTTMLERLLAEKREELAQDPTRAPAGRALREMLESLPRPISLAAALRGTGSPAVIAEFKRASPSEGWIREDADPETIAVQYVEAGAAAVSVLTDRHFEGTVGDLETVRKAVGVPVLCKDFMLERSQLVAARRAGADAVLLIVAALEAPILKQMIEFAADLGLEVLCEAHDDHEIDRALACGAQVVGVNARDLRTFEVDLQRCISLRSRVPASFVYVAESGIRGHDDFVRLRDAGVDAVLVGTHLMRAPNPGQALRALVEGEP